MNTLSFFFIYSAMLSSSMAFSMRRSRIVSDSSIGLLSSMAAGSGAGGAGGGVGSDEQAERERLRRRLKVMIESGFMIWWLGISFLAS